MPTAERAASDALAEYRLDWTPQGRDREQEAVYLSVRVDDPTTIDVFRSGLPLAIGTNASQIVIDPQHPVRFYMLNPFRQEARFEGVDAFALGAYASAIGDLMSAGWRSGKAAPTLLEVSDSPPPTDEAEGAAARLAREVRDLSGLSAQRLGAIFPVERESYQRWISGQITPSAANLDRLAVLAHFLREAALRVADVRVWLSTPLGDRPNESPYEFLRRGDLPSAWNALRGLPARGSTEAMRRADGSLADRPPSVLPARSVSVARGDDESSSDWFDDED